MITDPVIRENSKGLEVPDFNKKEVEGIAVDAVKKEIAEGGIPTGVKLYQHSVNLGAATISFLSTSSSAWSTIKNIKDNYICVSKTGSYVNATVTNIGYDVVRVFSTSVSDNTLGQIDLNTIYSDTVVEL